MKAVLSVLWLLLEAGISVPAFATDLPDRPTLYLIGDSTVNNSTQGQMGWGKPLPEFFDTNRITILNKARGGRSSRTYFTEGLWGEIRDSLKPGDFVLMQFGHNDGGSLTQNRARASLKGTGEETQAVTNPPPGKIETVHTYGWYLRTYVRDAKAKGASPIVCSLIPRNLWKDGKVVRASDGYAKWAAEIAAAESVPFIDLNKIIAQKYDDMGEADVAKKFFGPADHTHTTPEGAQFNAAAVVEGIRALTNCALASFLAAQSAPNELTSPAGH